MYPVCLLLPCPVPLAASHPRLPHPTRRSNLASDDGLQQLQFILNGMFGRACKNLGNAEATAMLVSEVGDVRDTLVNKLAGGCCAAPRCGVLALWWSRRVGTMHGTQVVLCVCSVPGLAAKLPQFFYLLVTHQSVHRPSAAVPPCRRVQRDGGRLPGCDRQPVAGPGRGAGGRSIQLLGGAAYLLHVRSSRAAAWWV